MRAALPLLLLLPIGACSSPEGAKSTFDPDARARTDAARQQAAEMAAARAGFRPDQPKPLATVSVEPVAAPAPGAILPPATMQYRYIGRWAASADLCRDGVWLFETRNLTTAGETHCKFPTVAGDLTSFTLQGECRADGKTAPQTLKLTFDETAKRMRVSSNLLNATLLYCGG